MNVTNQTVIIGDVILTPKALEAIRELQSNGNIEVQEENLDNSCLRLIELSMDSPIDSTNLRNKITEETYTIAYMRRFIKALIKPNIEE